jgi:type VII secretion-associated serine protease mycosin
VRLARFGVAVAFCAAATLAVLPLPAHADATRDRQWHLGFLRVTEAQKYSQGEGITVAVVDTGVDSNHPDLRGNVLPGTNLLPGGSGDGRRDTDGHGTGMGGLIAAHGHGAQAGALGIAPKAKLLPIQAIFGERSKNRDDTIAQAINYAVDQGAKVINLSVGVARSQGLRDAVERAREADIVLVAGSGNTTDGSIVPYPGGAEGVLTVAAIDQRSRHASISITGPEVDIAAPGVDITSTTAGGGYRTGTGTSDSTAIVSGAAALVRAKYPNLSADEVIHRLTATATDKGPPGRDEQYGYGVLNLVAALTANVPPAGQVNDTASATPSGSPSTTAAAAPAPGPNSSSNSSTTVLALVVLAALVVAGILAWLYARRRNRTADQNPAK